MGITVFNGIKMRAFSLVLLLQTNKLAHYNGWIEKQNRQNMCTLGMKWRHPRLTTGHNMKVLLALFIACVLSYIITSANCFK